MTGASKMNKNEVVAALRKEGIEFNKRATVAELRRLYDESMALNVMNKNSTFVIGNSTAATTEETTTATTEKTMTILKASKTALKMGTSDLQPINSDSDDSESEREMQRRLDALVLHMPTAAELKLRELKEEEAYLDAQLRVQEKKQRLLDLQLKNHSDADLLTPIAKHIFKPQYKDVKHLIQLFSGSEECDARKWIKDFERACDSVRADEHTCLVFSRQSMKSDSVAELFLRTDSSETYSEIKANFMANFDHRFSISEVIDKLRRTTFRNAKLTEIGYILKMQTIAARATIDEQMLIQLIIDGFEDRSAHIAVLYPAKTIQELKDLVHRYAQLREHSALSVQSTLGVRSKFKQNSVVSANSADQSTSVQPNVFDRSNVRCFNCSGLGHVGKHCPAPKRQKGSCFRCGSMQHVIKDCPKPPPPPSANQVALITEVENSNDKQEGDSNIGAINDVSVIFLKGCSEFSAKKFVSLFDSGSPVSLIKWSEIPKILLQQKKVHETGYTGIGNYKLCTYGIINVKIQFRNKKKMLAIMLFPII